MSSSSDPDGTRSSQPLAADASALLEPGSVQAQFAAPDGALVMLRWCEAAVAVRFEELKPVAAFKAVPGRRWGPGWWWSATTGGHVVVGSKAMRSQLMILDRDPRVAGLAGRPVRLIWREPGSRRVRSWVPQLFARYVDGAALLADCPSRIGAGGERAAQAAAVMAEVCAQVGFVYRRLAPVDEVLAVNLVWLAGYRHPRNAGGPLLVQALQEAFVEPLPLLEGAARVGDALTVLPSVFHALWSGRLAADLSAPLHERVTVWAVAG
ncbi:TnsA-like heteromeric transposase endonuclease subunit [Streptomyces sp. NPDC094149]|uniref:TnsA-like heteromeric transposase endonuclease subunit n=1 Tax=Streptomyces sp. NPDC094149 TaxID=3155079 RepID=UPI00332BD423